MPFISTASVALSEINQCSVSMTDLTVLCPPPPCTSSGNRGRTMQCSPNRVLNQCLVLTQSVRYCPVPTLQRCESDPIRNTVPLARPVPPMASASAWTISWRLLSSTLTILAHSFPSVSGRHAGKAWSVPIMATRLPFADFHTAWPPDGQVSHFRVCGSKEKLLHNLSLRLCSMWHCSVLPSPLANEKDLLVSMDPWSGLSCRRLDAALLAALTVLYVPPRLRGAVLVPTVSAVNTFPSVSIT